MGSYTTSLVGSVISYIIILLPAEVILWLATKYYFTLHYITLSAFQTPPTSAPTPKVTSGASTSDTSGRSIIRRVARISWRGVHSWENLHPSPTQLGGLGERCKLPQRGLGRSPSRQRFWCILDRNRSIWCYIKTINATILWSLKTRFFKLISQTINIIHYHCYFSTLNTDFTYLMGTCAHHLASCIKWLHSFKYSFMYIQISATA